MKILFVAANPMRTTRLALDEEMRTICAKVARSPQCLDLEFSSIWAARPDDLLQGVNEHEPQVLHFSGHGTVDGIAMAGEDGSTINVANDAIVRVCAIGAPKGLRVVLLNSCHSRTLAESLVDWVDFAIASEGSQGDLQAIAFSSSFYRAIGFGATVAEAVEQGIVSILLEGLDGSDKIRLFQSARAKDTDPYDDFHRLIRKSYQPLSSPGEARHESGEEASSRPSGPMVEVTRLDEFECMDFIDDFLDMCPAATLTYLDVDGVHAINSVYGSVVGDHVLEACCDLIGQHYVDQVCAICRLRGDQFVILESTAKGAAMKAMKRRGRDVVKKIQRFEWSTISPDLYVTATASMAHRQGTIFDGETAHSLLLRAILGVKNAKRLGKNKLIDAPIAIRESVGEPRTRRKRAIELISGYLS